MPLEFPFQPCCLWWWLFSLSLLFLASCSPWFFPLIPSFLPSTFLPQGISLLHGLSPLFYPSSPFNPNCLSVPHFFLIIWSSHPLPSTLVPTMPGNDVISSHIGKAWTSVFKLQIVECGQIPHSLCCCVCKLSGKITLSQGNMLFDFHPFEQDKW